ncbi:MAG: non-canonical purine NTP pyrophosphatase, RdgB/HAM1 family [Sulfurospirillum sp.]|nr:MAG: non-canonical purine NTP pyrophosphatase, RdgB/HAM1 family [Sulfurospirillum sp.]
MKIILASGNKGKIREIASYCTDHEVLPYSDIIEKFDVVEDGGSFQENALIKAQAVYEKIAPKLSERFIVLADDSGITVPALGNIPGIYSARYAGEGASDKENLYKLIDALKTAELSRTPAYYTAAMAIVTDKGDFTVHGWMHGDVIAEARGEKGFGYDPMFIPEGYEQTLGELDHEIKERLSHRSKALELAKKVIATL